MRGRFNPKQDYTSSEMRVYARQLRDKLMPLLPSEAMSVWLTVLAGTTRQVKELCLEVRKVYSGEIYAFCCFENRSERCGSSNGVAHRTMEEVMVGISDDKNLETITMMLQDLYENTHTWD